MKKLVVSFSLFVIGFTVSKSQTINTYAGNGIGGYSGDGAAATAAELKFPYGVTIDVSGNMYIADKNNNRIRKVTISTGDITTIAGTGTGAYNGDSIAATSAELYYPSGVAIDASGNIYIADFYNNRIRKMIASTGIIITIAGNGTANFSGDGGLATTAQLNNPTGVAVDVSGNVYIADQGNNRIRKVNTSGNINTVAGNGTFGYSGDGASATAAELSYPTGIALDTAGNIFIADTYSEAIRKVNTSGIISTIAGTGTQGYGGDGAAATGAKLNLPTGVAVDASGNIYIADAGNQRIRKVNVSGTISTFAGTGTTGYSGDGGPATSAKLASPNGVGVDASGNVYIADEGNNRIRKISILTGINEIGANSSVSIYPVPNSGKFTISFQSSVLNIGKEHIEIYNMLGKVIYESWFTPTNNLQIDISNHAKGIYLYRITGNEGSLIVADKIIIN